MDSPAPMDFRTSATKDLSALLDRLTQAADAATHAARAEAAAEAQVTIDAVTAQRATVQQALQEQTKATDAAQRANEALQRAKAALEADRAKLAQDLEAARAELASTRAELASARTDLSSARADHDALRIELTSAQVDHEALQEEFAALRAEAMATQEASEALLAESNAAQQALHAKLDEAVRAASETAARASQLRAEEGRTIRDQAIGLVSRTLDRMLAVTSAFGNVSTEDDVLAAVVESMATEFPRVALFKVALDRLDVLQHAGFDFPADYTHLVVPQPIAAVLDRAVTSGQIEMLSADAIVAAAGTPFGGTPTCALALPVDLEGEACAVLYADDSGAPHQTLGSTDLRRTFALVLRQLAAPLLARLPAEMKAIAELRAYAAHLVAELENMYAADADSHKKGHELRRRLQDNLECARGIYAQRVSSEAPAAAPLLEEELALAASVAHATPFGRDLSALLSAVEPRVAEA
jgi:chemotaxis protein histidine kinase CheA